MPRTLDGFSTATEMLGALRRHDISAVELLDLHLRRIERYDPLVNAVAIRDLERAGEAARAADAARARGDDRPLLGLPVTIKDCLDVAGLPTTAGLAERVNAVAERDAHVVARLRAAGAIIIGKTNVPPNLGDWQANNPIFGRTNNPWDLERSPGGSSGGSAAALAAGLTPLDYGSDKGGSIRFPAAWCGVFGHRPSFGIVPSSGHFPGSPRPNETLTQNVIGPLARSADDLELALDVVAGPEAGLEVAWRLQLPPSRHARLEEYRVAVLPAAEWRAVDSEITSAINDLAATLRGLGAQVTNALPPELGDLREHHGVFQSIGTATTPEILNAIFHATPETTPVELTEEYRRERAAAARAGTDPFAEARARGIECTAADFIALHDRREQYRAAWRRFFREWDVLLAPVATFLAPPHTTLPLHQRTTIINSQPASMRFAMVYASLPIVAGLPATAFPVGLSRDGLPIGIQAIGPFLEDRTPLRFAALVTEQLGGFRPPPGYDGV
jgi:amidase